MISMFARALTGMSQNLDGTHGYITRLNIPRFDTTGAAPVVAGTVETEVIRLASAQAQLQNAVDLIHLTNIGIEINNTTSWCGRTKFLINQSSS
jgi:hypothetical protein